jgi:diguanylate cyclase (GGDEF)-like protein/PAS domain S-box-containing protein
MTSGPPQSFHQHPAVGGADITDAVHAGEQLFRRLADSLPTGVILVDHRRQVVYANRRLEQVLGIPATETTAERLLALLEVDDRQLMRLALDRALDHDANDELEVAVPVGGAAVRCAISIVAVTHQDGPPQALVCVQDITRSAGLREELRFRATFDALTGCYNRGAALAALEMALADSPGAVGVLFIDLDRFKPVNDHLGHAVGDELLVAVVNRLRDVCRASDLVGRLGGDEFLLVCRNLHDAPTEAVTVAARVQLALQHPFLLTGHTVALGASIGVATGAAGLRAIDVLARADQAMYEAKREGSGPVLSGEPHQVAHT